MAEQEKAPDPKQSDPKPAEDKKAEPTSHFGAQRAGAGTRDDAAAGGARRQAVDDAMSMFGSRTSGVVIIGDGVQVGTLIGGDQATGPGGDQSGPILTEVTARTVVEIAAVYVEPDGFAELRGPLERHRLVLLGTRPRWGNTATGIRLLEGTTELYELRFAGRLAELPVDRLPKGAGFVLEALDARTLAALSPQYLDDLEERLVKADCRLVVLTDADRVAEHGGRAVWRMLETPPDAYELTVRHLEHRLGSREQAVELLDRAGTSAELRATTPGAFDVHRLVELACDLAEAARGHGTLADAAERFAVRADRAVEEWFDDEVTGVSARALVLALAVLNAMAFDAVSRAALLLEEAWSAQHAAPAAGTRERSSRRQRLKAARARLTMETRRTPYGPATLEIAAFLDSSYPQRILRHYWHEHDYDRPLLLEWLGEIADDVEVDVRTRASIAVGYLGTYAFDIVRRAVIVPWVAGEKVDERELAVNALALPAREPGTAARAVALVADWSRRGGKAARMTAARALGSSVGAVLDGGPDASLTRLAKGADEDLAVALGDSIAELMAKAEPDRQLVLLGLLDSWSAEGRNGRQLAGILGFLQVGWTLWTEVDGVRWPTLLWIADHDDAARDVVARLWSRALVAPDADDGLWVVLRTWAQLAERTEALRPAFVRLFTAVPTTRRQADLLKRHAETLRTGKPASPDTARKLLDALMKGL
ncbi:hypothetical protein [Actinoplanes sp. NPDC051494]|uniref:hypothetical protein n=1 Tax=Actinoplanes sp. NPDC051494 TaxID=3363907 RepID=UPI0037BC3FC3